MVSLNHCCSSLVLHSPSLTPCWWDGREDQKNKSQKKTCSLRQIQFHSQNKSCTSKQGISSPLGQAGVQPSLGKGSITHVGDMGRQNLSLQMPPCPSFLLPPAFYTEHDGSGIFLGSVGVSWPGCVGPSFMYTPNLPAGGVGWEAEKILIVCNNCSAIKKISLNYQHIFQHKSKTQCHTRYSEENYVYPSQNQHNQKSSTSGLSLDSAAQNSDKAFWHIPLYMEETWEMGGWICSTKCYPTYNFHWKNCKLDFS